MATNISKYTPEIVGLDYDILHYPFWLYEFKSLNFAQDNTVRKQMNGGFVLEITNPCATFREASILLGLIKLYEYKIMVGDFRKNNISDNDDNIIGYSYVITTNDREMCDFCGVAKGKNTTKFIKDAVKILAEITAHYTNHDKKLELWTGKTFHFVRTFLWSQTKGRGAHHTIEMDGNFLDGCRKKNFTINHSIIQKQKDQLTKGLLMYLSGRKSAFIPLRNLHQWFGISKPKAPTTGCSQYIYQIWQAQMGIYDKQCETFHRRLHITLLALNGLKEKGEGSTDEKPIEKIVIASVIKRTDGKYSYIKTKTKKGVAVDHIICRLSSKYKYSNKKSSNTDIDDGEIPF
jgi:hypothetical protein